MKFHSFYILALFCLSCQFNTKKAPLTTTQNKSENHILVSEIQSVLDSNKVVGSVLVYDLVNDTYYSNDFDWADKGHLPASTFKIANTIIGLESGALQSEKHVFNWDGTDRYLKSWEQDLILKDAFQFSCVPCYQQLARDIGARKMNQYLRSLSFGEMKVDLNTIDNFWLVGDSRISQMEQIDFLKRLYKSELPISKKTESTLKDIMLIESSEAYNLRAKTGLAIFDDYQNGWFVGYIEAESNTYIFATNISPKGSYDQKSFLPMRKVLTIEVLKRLKFID